MKITRFYVSTFRTTSWNTVKCVWRYFSVLKNVIIPVSHGRKQEVSQNDIKTAIHTLNKTKRSWLIDLGIFIEFKYSLLSFVHNLSNLILQSVIFLKMWAKSVIAPITKILDTSSVIKRIKGIDYVQLS